MRTRHDKVGQRRRGGFRLDGLLVVFLVVGWLLIFASATMALQRSPQQWLRVKIVPGVSADYSVDAAGSPRLAPVRPQIVEEVKRDALVSNAPEPLEVLDEAASEELPLLVSGPTPTLVVTPTSTLSATLGLDQLTEGLCLATPHLARSVENSLELHPVHERIPGQSDLPVSDRSRKRDRSEDREVGLCSARLLDRASLSIERLEPLVLLEPGSDLLVHVAEQRRTSCFVRCAVGIYHRRGEASARLCSLGSTGSRSGVLGRGTRKPPTPCAAAAAPGIDPSVPGASSALLRSGWGWGHPWSRWPCPGRARECPAG